MWLHLHPKDFEGFVIVIETGEADIVVQTTD